MRIVELQSSALTTKSEDLCSNGGKLREVVSCRYTTQGFAMMGRHAHASSCPHPQRDARQTPYYRSFLQFLWWWLYLSLASTTAAAIPAEGNVTTVFHTTGSPRNVHFDATTGEILYTQSHSVNRIHANGTAALVAGSAAPGNSVGVGVLASFNDPRGVARSKASPDAMYLVDRYNHCLRHVHLPTRNVTSFAGLCGTVGSGDGIGTGRFNYPIGIALYHDATTGMDVYLYVADFSNNNVRRVDIATSHVETFAGTAGSQGAVDGPRMTALFHLPIDVTVDATGQWVYVVGWHNCIRKIDATGSNGTVATLAGICGSGSSYYGFVDGVGNLSRLFQPHGVTMNSNGRAVYVADTYNCAIRRIATADGNVSTVAGMLGCGGGLVDGPLAVARFQTPNGIYLDSTSSSEEVLVVADNANNAIRRVVLAHATHSASQLAVSASASRTDSATVLGTHANGHRKVPPTLSLTVSPSWWTCGSMSDLRNISLETAPPLANITSDQLGTATLVVTAAETINAEASTSEVPAHAYTGLTGLIAAAPLPRLALLAYSREDLPQLQLSLHLLWPSAQRWDLVSARSVHHDELLAFNATPSLSSIPDGRHVTVLMWAPRSSSMGWLPEGLGVFAWAEIVIELGLACSAEGGNTSGGNSFKMRVVVPAPGAPRELAKKVDATVAATQWTTTVGGPGVGSAVGRVAAVRSMVMCGIGDDNGPSGGGLLAIRIACGDKPPSGAVMSMASARGAIIGNAGILATSIGLCFVLTAMYARMTRVSFGAAGLRLALPSVLLPVWIATLPSTSAGAVELLLNSGGLAGCPFDIGAALVGVLLCAVPPCWICFVALRLVSRLDLHVVEHNHPVSLTAASFLGRLRNVVHVTLRSNASWEPSSIHTCSPHLRASDALTPKPTDRRNTTAVEPQQEARQARVLLHEYRALWYAVADTVVLVASGVFSAMTKTGSQSMCIGAAASVCGMYAAQLVACALVRPFTTRFAFVHALMTLMLSATSVGLHLGGIIEESSGRSDAASLELQTALVYSSAACDLCVVGISVVRVLLDMIAACKAVRRIISDVFRGIGAAAACALPPAIDPPSSQPSPDILRDDCAVLSTLQPGPISVASDGTDDLLCCVSDSVSQRPPSIDAPLPTLESPAAALKDDSAGDSTPAPLTDAGDDFGDTLFWDAAGNALQPSSLDVDSEDCLLLGLPPVAKLRALRSHEVRDVPGSRKQRLSNTSTVAIRTPEPLPLHGLDDNGNDDCNLDDCELLYIDAEGNALTNSVDN